MKKLLLILPLIFSGCVTTNRHLKEVQNAYDIGYGQAEHECVPSLVSCLNDSEEKNERLRKFNQVDENGNLYYKDEGY